MGVKVNKSTITQILQAKEKRLADEHQTILSDALLIEKAKMLANELGVPEDKL
ncbi:6652_t:CDS:2 [Racocetra persica]|uniref:6652_t:CDS:1 n=1 Tax=Racocetra persica TaxID=160502 RepID=A0ACA9M8M3_9GLOM|nr:6652_t:CDS:2 [Racocetra persica]